jgi:hypothetical protein
MSTEQKTDLTTPRLDRFGAARNRLVAKAKAAAGKALIVYLATGSLGAAVVAFIIFKVMGC